MLSFIEVWFTDQNSKPLEIVDKREIDLVINLCVKYENDSLFNSVKRSIFVKDKGVFFFFSKNMDKNIDKLNISKNRIKKLQYQVRSFNTESIDGIFPKNLENSEIKNELSKIK